MHPKDKIREVLERRKEVVLAYLYGSSVRGYERADSDLDLGILLREEFDADPLYPARIAMEIETKANIDRELDVRILNGMPPRFLRQVIDGELLFSRDESERVRFETGVIDSYLDFKPFYDQYDQKRRERLLGEAE
jgi:predicted nucleotidyltransferase